jgi:adenine-specific DNA methylase
MLARADYEAKMLLAFNEYHRVLRPDGVMTVQFNHKDPGAWDVLANALMKTMEIALKVLPTSTSESDALVSLRLAMDEIKAKVIVEQLSLSYG